MQIREEQRQRKLRAGLQAASTLETGEEVKEKKKRGGEGGEGDEEDEDAKEKTIGEVGACPMRGLCGAAHVVLARSHDTCAGVRRVVR